MSSDTGMFIVTGGGTGIGQATVQSLAGAGHDCVVFGRSSGTLQQTVELCEPLRGRVISHVGDVNEADDVAELIRVAEEQSGLIHGVVNNAAAAGPVPFPDWDVSQIDMMWKTNVLGPLSIIRAAWPKLLHSGGRIVNISSLAVLGPFPGNGLYGMTKCALDGLTRAIHSDAGDSGVKAFSIAPGAVETDMLRTIVDETQLPPAKAMAPGEIAQLILACLGGERDEDAGEVLYAPIPGFVTSDADEALAAMGRFHGS